MAVDIWTEMHQIGYLLTVRLDRRPHLKIQTHHRRKNLFMKRSVRLGSLTPANPDHRLNNASQALKLRS
jgi:hypothetical protein